MINILHITILLQFEISIVHSKIMLYFDIIYFFLKFKTIKSFNKFIFIGRYLL